MSDQPPEQPLLFLDACCIINFYATGHVEEILRCLPYRFAVSRLVADEEVLSIRRTAESSDPSDREPVSLRALESSGRLTIMELVSDEEKAEFAHFASRLDDGEASVGSLAVVHGGGVATDDRKALRILGGRGVTVLQTPELLFEWARRAQVSETRMKEALQAVRDRARFHPRKTAPHFLWWNGFFR